ncbi:hypothetical protein GGI15_002964 [Coemansia interrupta]|uniref:Uncharacterized protein n=1 Tax=Coemansia interrupta TaxID=1126814 RepID=A0A9W8LIU5_9FUNG|nr:hypothetical protein GGI15_002964 [Coemansia interrupta]
MAHFYISSTHVASSETMGYRMEPVHQQTVLDMSVKKLYAIKKDQRSGNRQASLLKTVLVYNLFKAAMAEPATKDNGTVEPDVQPSSSQSAAEMDVDVELDTVELVPQQEPSDASTLIVPEETETAVAAAVAAEQSWFDHCIDKILTEDDLEMDYDEDEDEDVGEVDFAQEECAGAVVIFDPTRGGEPQESSVLKRSPSSTYINSCQLSQVTLVRPYLFTYT